MGRRVAVIADDLGRRLNWVVERFCALLMAILVLVIWFEVLQRYLLHLGFTWGEELSRYIMIWAALMAVPCGAYRREHIGLEFVSNALRPSRRRVLRQGAAELIAVHLGHLEIHHDQIRPQESGELDPLTGRRGSEDAEVP